MVVIDQEQEQIEERLASMDRDLRQMIFTASRDWHRSFRIDRKDRDLLVMALVLLRHERNRNAKLSSPHDKGE